MANERILINGVTKIEYKGTYIYLFPLAQITAFPNTDIGKGYYKVLLLESGITLPTVEFGDITDPLGAADIVEYVDALATNTYYFNPINAGSIMPSGASGWARYSDTQYNVGNKFSIAPGVTSTLPNNAGAVIDLELNGIQPLYDHITSRITPENFGDSYVLRVAFSMENSSVNGLAEVDLNIGGTVGNIFARTFTFPKGANTLVEVTFAELIFSLDTFIANGGHLTIKSITGTTQIWDVLYVITRTHKGTTII